MSEPWYVEGLRFECQADCGACCTNHDDYAYVYLEGDDLARLAAHLGLDDRTFTRRYTRSEDGHRFLKMDQPDCPFLDGNRCTVYEARPRQCRSFPFWDETLETPASWQRLECFCPGIGKGRTHSLRVIRNHLDTRHRGE